MKMIDFVYAGKRLSDYGYIIASVITETEDSLSLGSTLSFNTVKNNATFINRIVNIDYDEPISITFDICKDPRFDRGEIHDSEVTYMMKWLNRKNYEEFRPVYDDGSYADIYYNGSFNISAIYVGGEIKGFTLAFTSNSPFGYIKDRTVLYKVANENGSFTYYCDSDEIGYLLPKSFEVTCLASGNLTISNNLDTVHTVSVKNCENGEVITFDSKNQLISTNVTHTKLYNDFNYSYPRFVVDEDATKNVFTSSLPCSIKVVYAPVRKVGIIV